MFNKVMLIGRVGKTESYNKPGKTKLCVISLALNRKHNGVEVVDWFNCVTFDKTASFVEKYIEKGDLVSVEGRIQTHEYEKDGHSLRSFEISCTNLVLLARKKSGDNAHQTDSVGVIQDDADIPF